MDTIGSIQPTGTTPTEPGTRHESFERLRFIAQNRRCGVLVGSRGAGKTALLEQLEHELLREGTGVSFIHLAGLTAGELAVALSSELGLLGSLAPSRCEVWTVLQDYTHASQRTGHAHVFIFDQLDRVDVALTLELERLLTLFRGVFGVVLATRPGLAPELKSVLRGHRWLTVKLDRLTLVEASQTVARAVSQSPRTVQLSPAVPQAAHAATDGRFDKLQKLTELALLAAEAEALEGLDVDLIRAIQEEFSLK